MLMSHLHFFFDTDMSFHYPAHFLILKAENIFNITEIKIKFLESLRLTSTDPKTLLASLISPKGKDREEKMGSQNSSHQERLAPKLETQISLKCQV